MVPDDTGLLLMTAMYTESKVDTGFRSAAKRQPGNVSSHDHFRLKGSLNTDKFQPWVKFAYHLVVI